MGSPNIIGK
jgi:hypothetical protein